MSVDKDPLLSGLKWRCKVCMMTMSLLDHGDADLAAMKQHVIRHRSVMTGSKDPSTENMNWRKFVQSVGIEPSISQTRYT